MNMVYFMNDIPSEFICAYCKSLLNTPVACSECLEANYCQKCSEITLQNTAKCLVCKAAWCDKTIKPNPYFLKLYNQSLIHCSNKNCSWQGKFAEYFLHENYCELKSIKCFCEKYGCEWSGVKAEAENHKKTCVFQPFIKYFQQKDEEILYLKEHYKKMEESFDLNLRYSGVLQNISLKELEKSGFLVGLQKPYDYANTFEEILQFRNKKYVFLAAKKKEDDNLILAAMGRGSVIFQETKHNKCILENNVYWYFCQNYSVGFSSTNEICLNKADTNNLKEDTLKLSWHLDGRGGYRVGAILSLNTSKDYEKLILYNK